MARRRVTKYPVPHPPKKMGPVTRRPNSGGATIKQHHTARPGASGATTPKHR